MTPRILEGSKAKYIYFPEEQGTIISRSSYATLYIGANADTKEKIVLKKISTSMFGNDAQRSTSNQFLNHIFHFLCSYLYALAGLA